MRSGVRRSLWLAAILLWTVGVGAGLKTLWTYENAPGPRAAAPARWPAATRLDRPGGRPTLIVALHPQCPCSRATVAELARLVAHAAAPADIHALVVAAPGFDEALVHSDLWRAAAAIPGVRVRRDDGTEARRFGARVSGQVFAYDAAGALGFSGGLTGSRGHEGDNAGRTAIEAMLAGRPHAASAFVFGCLLFDGDGQPVPERTTT
jgi:hypothetical protein